MLIKLQSENLFLEFINKELRKMKSDIIYYTAKNSGMDVGEGFQHKRFTLAFIGEAFAYIYEETIPNNVSDQFLDSIYQQLSQSCDFQELNTIKLEQGALVLD